MTAPENIGLLLSLASAQGVAAANARLRPLDLNTRSYSLLEALAAGEGAGEDDIDGEGVDGVSQRDLADTLRLDPSQIVALVDGLERRGLAERRPNPQDRRQKLVVATTPGRDLYRRARQNVEASIDEVLVDLDTAERATLLGLLKRIVRPTAVTIQRAS
jgi:DNA-binding MarR family transcriptional regulator